MEIEASAGLRLDSKVKASRLVQDGKLLYEMGKLDESQAKLEQALKQDPLNPAANYYLDLVGQARAGRNGIPRDLLPSPAPYARTNQNRLSTGRQVIVGKLLHIRLDEVSFEGMPLGEVLRRLADEARKHDPEKHGVNFLISSALGANAPSGVAADPAPPDSKPETSAKPVALTSLPITIQPPLTNVRLSDVLDAIVRVAGEPLKYSIEDYAVVFSF